MQSRPPKRRGFILAAAIAICLIMVIIASIMSSQTQRMQNFTQNAQDEALETELAQFAQAQLRGVLQGNGNPGTIGMSVPVPASATLTASHPDSEATITGPVTHRAPSDINGPNGYLPTIAINGVSGMQLPPSHTAVSLTAKVGNDSIPQKYLTVYSSQYPYAVLATSGGVILGSLRSVSNYDGQDANISGVMANGYARGAMVIGGRVNGRVYSQGSVTVGQGGIRYPNHPTPVALPADFSQQLTAYKSALSSGAYASNLATALNNLHDALHRNFQTEITAAWAAEPLMGPGVLTGPVDPTGGASATQATVNSPGSTDYDSAGGTLTVGTSLRIPNNANESITFNQVNISQDLLLEDNTVFRVRGNLSVTGAIRIGRDSTLYVEGTTQCNAIGLTYTNSANNVSIRSSIYSTGGITSTTSMHKATVTSVPVPPTPTSNPYPSNLNPLVFTVPGTPPTVVTLSPPNPLAAAFTARQVADMAVLVPGLAPYLRTVVPTGLTTTDVPGAFIVSDSGITMPAGPKAAGLFHAPNILGTTGTFVGAIYAGQINLTNCNFRYFPYFTRAFAHTPGSNVTVGATEYHQTAGGKLP